MPCSSERTSLGNGGRVRQERKDENRGQVLGYESRKNQIDSPELGSDLVTALASLDVDDLTARRTFVIKNIREKTAGKFNPWISYPSVWEVAGVGKVSLTALS